MVSGFVSSRSHPLTVFIWAVDPRSPLERCRLCCKTEWGGADRGMKVLINTDEDSIQQASVKTS